MSAIFGIIDFEGRPIDPEWIKSMQRDLAHRGPDGHGLYQEASMFMGHMLLQVTPESVYDKSPYEEDGLVITAHARLDEREAIMDRLNIPDSERETIIDALLLLRSFKKFGKDFVKDIYGDFAFAIWDKEKKELFCARDQIGVKPFLYYFENNRFVFSSELKSLVNLSIVSAKINHELIRNEYFDIENKLGTTIWQSINRLPSANSFNFTKTKFTQERYWKPRRKSPKFKTLEESTLALKKVITQSIEDRMRSTHKIGIPLSGGFDSGTIACVAAKIARKNNQDLISVSSILDPLQKTKIEYFDESRFIKDLLIQEPNIKAEFIYHSELNPYKDIYDKFKKYYTTFNTFNYVDEAIYQKLNKNKVRRVLSGFYGDITVTNRSINPIPHLILSGKFLSAIHLLKLIQSERKISFKTAIKIYLIWPFTPSIYKYFKLKYSGSEFTWNIDLPFSNIEIFNEELKKNIKKAIIKRMKYDFNLTNHIWPVNHELYREDFDTGSSHHFLEMTYPLMDRRIVECLLRIPVEFFFANGQERGLIKSAMKSILPNSIIERNIKGYYSPGFYEIYENNLTQIINELNLINSGNFMLKELFDLDKLISALSNFDISRNNYNFENNQWIHINIAHWVLFTYWYEKDKRK